MYINDLSKITYGTRVTLENEVEYNTTSDGYLYLESGTNSYVACFLMDMNNPTSNAHYFSIKCTGITDNDSKNAVFVRKGTVLKKQGGSGTATFIPLT